MFVHQSSHIQKFFFPQIRYQTENSDTEKHITKTKKKQKA